MVSLIQPLYTKGNDTIHTITITATVTVTVTVTITVIITIAIPEHVFPSPLKPGSHIQRFTPLSLKQCADAPHWTFWSQDGRAEDGMK